MKTSFKRLKIVKRETIHLKNQRIMKPFWAKKGITPWISWVLLLAFVVVLGGIVSVWMKERVIDSVDSTVRTIYNSEDCDTLAIDVVELVQENSQTLNIKVVNTYDKRIDQLTFTLYNSNFDIINVSTANITIKPNENKTIKIGTNQTVAILEVVPIYFKNKQTDTMIRAVCNDKSVEKNLTA